MYELFIDEDRIENDEISERLSIGDLYTQFGVFFFFFSSRRRHTRYIGDWSSDVCSSDLAHEASAIRAGVADAMRRSWTRPLSTIGSSVNLDPVLQDRQSRDPKPGPGLYALRALALALAENPGAAAKLIGNRVVQSNSLDVGIAVEAEDGIMVPVVRTADKTSLADLTTKYKELVELARQR